MNHLYLIQAPGPLPSRYEFLRKSGREFLLLSFKEESPDTTIFFPRSTWTTGRNRFREYILERGLEQKYDYLTFLDEDVSFVTSDIETGFSRFEELLEKYRPFISNPELGEYYLHYGKIDVPVQSTIWFDGIMNAYSREAFESSVLFPYVDKFDSVNWWMSQYALIILGSLYFRHRICFFNGLLIENVAHSDYPRENTPKVWTDVVAYIFDNLVSRTAIAKACGNTDRLDAIAAALGAAFRKFEHVTLVEESRSGGNFPQMLALPQLRSFNIRRALGSNALSGENISKEAVETFVAGEHLQRKMIHILYLDKPGQGLHALQCFNDRLRDVAFVVIRRTPGYFLNFKNSAAQHEYLEKVGFELLTKRRRLLGCGDSLYCNSKIVRDFDTEWGVFPDVKDFVEIQERGSNLTTEIST